MMDGTKGEFELKLWLVWERYFLAPSSFPIITTLWGTHICQNAFHIVVFDV